MLKSLAIRSSCVRYYGARLPPINPKDFELPDFKDPRETGLKHNLTLDDIQPPPSYNHIKMPKEKKLPYVPSQPILAKEEKMHKTLHHIIGVEEDVKKNTILNKQYGIVALRGGYFLHEHFEHIRNAVNAHMEDNLYAQWVIPPPWKPITKKTQGARMGGGKGDIHHYVTPVKKFNVIFVVGGKFQYVYIKKWFESLANVMPVPAAAVSYEELEAMKEQYFSSKRPVDNPFTAKNIVDYNIGGLRTNKMGPLQIKYYYEFT